MDEERGDLREEVGVVKAGKEGHRLEEIRVVKLLAAGSRDKVNEAYRKERSVICKEEGGRMRVHEERALRGERTVMR